MERRQRACMIADFGDLVSKSFAELPKDAELEWLWIGAVSCLSRLYTWLAEDRCYVIPMPKIAFESKQVVVTWVFSDRYCLTGRFESASVTLYSFRGVLVNAKGEEINIATDQHLLGNKQEVEIFALLASTWGHVQLQKYSEKLLIRSALSKA